MQKIKRGIRQGVQVEQGQTIGFVGSTGLATGPHLCFRFWKNNKQVDALKVELWKRKNENSEKDLIIFMPGLGGNINNFRWI